MVTADQVAKLNEMHITRQVTLSLISPQVQTIMKSFSVYNSVNITTCFFGDLYKSAAITMIVTKNDRGQITVAPVLEKQCFFFLNVFDLKWV